MPGVPAPVDHSPVDRHLGGPPARHDLGPSQVAEQHRGRATEHGVEKRHLVGGERVSRHVGPGDPPVLALAREEHVPAQGQVHEGGGEVTPVHHAVDHRARQGRGRVLGLVEAGSHGARVLHAAAHSDALTGFTEPRDFAGREVDEHLVTPPPPEDEQSQRGHDEGHQSPDEARRSQSLEHLHDPRRPAPDVQVGQERSGRREARARSRPFSPVCLTWSGSPMRSVAACARVRSSASSTGSVVCTSHTTRV